MLNDFAIWTTLTESSDSPVLPLEPPAGSPVVSEGTIRWSGDEFHEVYLQSDMTLVCSGGSECVVAAGTYLVINTETYERWEDVVVTHTLAVGPHAVQNPDTESLRVVDCQVVDAEYSLSLDRIILVSAHPSVLRIVGGSPFEDRVVELNGAPQSVSVSPDGYYAAVTHDGWVSYVNLVSEFVQANHPLETSGEDIVLAGNGYAYVFPSSDQWVSIHSLDLINGGETLSDYAAVYAGIQAKLHPDGQKIYGVDDNIEQYGISAGPVSVNNGYRYSEYAVCNDLWMGKDGRRIFTQCGNVFRASAVDDEDMRYNGSLSAVSRILHLDHSLETDNIALIPMASEWWSDDLSVGDDHLQFYGYQILDYLGSRLLPSFIVNEDSFQTYGKFVCHSAAGDQLHIVVQASSDSGLFNDVAIWTIEAPQ